MLEIIFVNDKNATETVLRIRKLQVLSYKWAKSQTKTVFFTKYSIFIVNVKSGRFMYQSGRAGDEAKKRKSPAKSGRVGIYVISEQTVSKPWQSSTCNWLVDDRNKGPTRLYFDSIIFI